jgi:hypothetical protein
MSLLRRSETMKLLGAQASSLLGLLGFDNELLPKVKQAKQRGCLRSQ